MKNNEIVETAEVIIIACIVAPVVIGVACKVIWNTYAVSANFINTIKFRHKMKKGLENGSITQFEGKFYEAVLQPTEEA